MSGGRAGSGRGRPRAASQRRASAPARGSAGRGATPDTPGDRLQKVLADLGLGSRREAERWIADGRVRINGEVAVLGARVTGRQTVTVDGRPVTRRRREAPAARVLAYHKPEGEVSTRRDPEGRPTVHERLPRGRWIPVGRLDVNTSGLLLFTSDGALAEALMHPRRGVEREYAVRIFGEVPEGTVERLRDGVLLEDGPAHFDEVADAGGQGRNHWYRVVIREGRQREVRRLWESQGLRVSRLIRVRYGPVSLSRSLRPGRWQELDAAGVEALRQAAGLSHPPRAPRRRRSVRRRPA